VVVNLPTVERGDAIADAVLARSPAPALVGYVHLGQLPSVIGARYLAALRDRLAPRHLARFDLLLTVSQATADQVAALVSRPVHTVYPASIFVPAAHHLDRATARHRLGLGDGPVIGLVGRVDFHQKGHDTAVRTARRLADRGIAATWAVIGDGPDLGRMRQMVARMNLADRFAFLGWRRDIPEVLPALDVLALPSKFEGLPLTAVEALSARVPVVAFAVDGLAELLAPPFAVPPQDDEAFAAALAQVLHHPASWPAEEQAAQAARLCDPSAVARRILAALNLGTSVS
jgi:glycosyltransferase involved in cell wall biosynthesis